MPDKQQYLGPLVLFRGLWRKYKMTEYTQLSQLLQISLFQEDFFFLILTFPDSIKDLCIKCFLSRNIFLGRKKNLTRKYGSEESSPGLTGRQANTQIWSLLQRATTNNQTEGF